MTFVQTAVERLRLPLPIVRRGASKLLELLGEHAEESDFDALRSALPDFDELRRNPPTRPAPAWLRRVQRLTRRARSTQRALRSTGLQDDDVAFVSAFAIYVRQLIDEATADRLIQSVPGLRAMTGWPLSPYRRPELLQNNATNPQTPS